MADDVLVEAAIGVAPTNPSGKGVAGKEELGASSTPTSGPTT